ncbi:retrovirus-related pol polyprotein from transposon TNT 1-94 [Tanacetum coccineum]
MGLPEDIYATIDSCETTQEIWLRVEQIMKGSNFRAQEKKAKLFNEWEKFKSTEGESIESYYNRFSKLMNDFFIEKHFLEKIANNLAMNMAFVVGGNSGNQFRQYARQNTRNQFGYNAGQIEENQNGYNTTQNVRNQVVQNAIQNLGIQNGNQTRLIVVPGIANPNANQNGNSNVVAVRAGGNVNGNNGNQIWCYNYRGMGHLARNCTVRPRRRDAAYLQTQLLSAQKKKQGSNSKLKNMILWLLQGILMRLRKLMQIAS